MNRITNTKEIKQIVKPLDVKNNWVQISFKGSEDIYNINFSYEERKYIAIIEAETIEIGKKIIRESKLSETISKVESSIIKHYGIQ